MIRIQSRVSRLKFVFMQFGVTVHSVDKRSKPGSLVEVGFSSEKCDKMIGDPFRIVRFSEYGRNRCYFDAFYFKEF